MTKVIPELNQKNLKEIGKVQKPGYDRGKVTAGILHIGLGNFHRAHQTIYIDDLLENPENSGWGIVSAIIRKDQAALCQHLSKQDGLYTIKTVSPRNEINYRIIGSIIGTVDGVTNPQKVIEYMADPAIKIITSTVTEGGYYLTQDSERVDHTHPDVAEDIAGGLRTYYGFLRAGLTRRAEKNAGPVTLVSCDNLRMNGDSLKKGLLTFLEQCRQSALLKWIEKNVSFPNSMVDRITPRTEPGESQELCGKFGYVDQAVFKAESFIQWALEDNFTTPRPPFEAAGVEMVSDIHEKEESKIRILNGSHSGLAWYAAMEGYDFYHQAIRDPELFRFIDEYVTGEVIPMLDFVSFDLDAYKQVIYERFGNEYLPDSISRLATEGISRIPKFVLPTIYDRLERGLDSPRGFEILAAWFVFLAADRQNLNKFKYQDQEISLIDGWFSAEDPFREFTDARNFWGVKKEHEEAFRDQLSAALKRIPKKYLDHARRK